MPMPSVPDFSWYKTFTRLLPDLFGTNFVLLNRLYGTIFSGTIFLVQFLFLGAVYVVNKTSLSKPNFGKRNGAYGHFCCEWKTVLYQGPKALGFQNDHTQRSVFHSVHK
jgi:hypothetical protein